MLACVRHDTFRILSTVRLKSRRAGVGCNLFSSQMGSITEKEIREWKPRQKLDTVDLSLSRALERETAALFLVALLVCTDMHIRVERLLDY